MARDFSKDLTIMVAGSGNVTMPHLEATLAEWIFGNVEEREVHVILPLFSDMGPGIRNLIKLGMEWEFKFTVVQANNSPMTRELSALSEDNFIYVDDERDALETGLSLLDAAHVGNNETAFLMAYNPKSTYEKGNPNLSDFEIIGDAKNYNWLSTLNLCEGLIDSFEGYESTDEILKRERLQKEFDDKQRAEEAAKPKAEKKAPAPRKRAAKKAVTPKVTKPVEEPEKPLEDVPVGTVVEVGGIEFTKKGPNPFREPLPTDALLGPTISANVFISPKDEIWEDVNKAQLEIPKPSNYVAVSKDDLAELSQNIKDLTGAFGQIMDTFTRILKDS